MSKGNQTKSTKLYQHSPYVYGNNFYIHKHIESIGRMAGGTPKSDTTLAIIFHRYKESSAKAVRKQYISYVKGSMNKLSPGAEKTIDEALNNENSSDKILSRLHSVLQRSFEEQFDNSHIIAAMEKQSNLNWSLKTNKKAQELNKIFQSNGRNGDRLQGFLFLDEILQALEYTCQQLNTSYSKGLAVILKDQQSNYKTTRELGRNLQKALNNFTIENDGGTLTKADIEQGNIMIQQLNNLASVLSKNQTKTGAAKGKLLTVRALQSLFQQSIFPSLSELFINEGLIPARDYAIYDTLGAFVNSAKISATDTSYLQAYTPEGEIIDNQILKNIGVKEGQETKDYGKADSLVNIDLNGSMITGKYHGTINMSVGISTKAYVTNSIGIPLNKNYDKYSLGRGLNLGQAFSLIPGLSVYDKYLGYNVISRDVKQLPKAIISLQDILVTRGLAYLASGRGPGDSAQLLFLNGNIMSMWDIIQYGMYNNIGKSGSLLGKHMSQDNNNGIYVSIASRPEIISYAQSVDWRTRIIDTNKAINSAVMQLEIIPKKIIDYTRTLTR